MRSHSEDSIRAFVFGMHRSVKDRRVQDFLRSLCCHLADKNDGMTGFIRNERWERFGERNPYDPSYPRGRAGCAFALAPSDYAGDKELPVVFDKDLDPEDQRQNRYNIRDDVRPILIIMGAELLAEKK